MRDDVDEVTLLLGVSWPDLAGVVDQDDVDVMEGAFEDCLLRAPRSARYYQEVLALHQDLVGRQVSLGVVVGPMDTKVGDPVGAGSCIAHMRAGVRVPSERSLRQALAQLDTVPEADRSELALALGALRQAKGGELYEPGGTYRQGAWEPAQYLEYKAAGRQRAAGPLNWVELPKARVYALESIVVLSVAGSFEVVEHPNDRESGRPAARVVGEPGLRRLDSRMAEILFLFAEEEHDLEAAIARRKAELQTSRGKIVVVFDDRESARRLHFEKRRKPSVYGWYRRGGEFWVPS